MTRRKRCPNGSRKNKSGTCRRKMFGPKKHRCSRGYRRTRSGKNRYCKKTKYTL